MTESSNSARFGLAGFALGATALLAALLVFWAGPFAPQQTAGVSLGELAGEIGKSALRSVAGIEQPAPKPVARTIDDYLEMAVAALGALAIILAATGAIRREDTRTVIVGASLGAAAIAFQFLTWLVLVIAGVLIISVLLGSFGGFFTGLFGG